jgi:hypothetical protein
MRLGFVLAFGWFACRPDPDVELPKDSGDETGSTVPATGDPEPGDLVITEFLVESAACDGGSGQWIEFVNVSTATFDVGEGQLSLASGDTAIPLSAGRVLPGVYTLIGPEGGSCGGVSPDLTWPVGTTLESDPEDGLVLLFEGTDIDEVPLGSLGAVPAVSRSLGRPETALRNNDASAWCDGTAEIGASGDKGSPGVRNAECPTEAGTPLTVDQLAPGQLVITEMLLAPSCSPSGAWLEVYNASGRSVDLTGLKVTDGSEVVTVQGVGVLVVGDYAVLAAGDAASFCGASLIAADGFFGPLSLDAGETISVGAGDPFLVLDAVATANFPQTTGVSAQVDAAKAFAALNDDASAWCESELLLPSATQGERGTPGTTNAACPIDVPAGPKLGDALDPGDLVITEVMADPLGCPDYDAEYFEVFNASGSDLNLKGLTINVSASGTVTLSQDYLVPANTWALATYVGGSGAIADCYVGVGYDFLWQGATMNNGGAMITLSSAGRIVDVVNLAGAFSTSGVSLQLDPAHVDPADNDDLANWCESPAMFVGGYGDYGSPRVANPSCPGTVVDTADTDPGDSGPVVLPPVGVSTLGAGGLVITEVMAAPVDCSDFQAEYVEIYNPGDRDVDLTGLTVQIGSSSSPLGTPLAPIPAHGYAILRYSTGSAPSCYGVGYTGLYSAKKLDDTGDFVAIKVGATTLDSVDTTGWSWLQGYAKQLDREDLTATLNDDEVAWCDGTATFAGSTLDRGSPGAENDDCAEVVVDTSATDTGTTPPSETPRVLGQIGPGDLVITEFMPGPEDCSDFSAEYVEVYNPGSSPIDITGLTVQIQFFTGTVFSVGAPIPAGGYALLRYSTGGTPTCYGVGFDALYSSGRMLDTGGLVVLKAGAIVVDQIDASGWTLPLASARQLDPTRLTAAQNDDESAWCFGVNTFAGSVADLGTPRQPNDACLSTGGGGDTPGDTPVDTPTDTGTPSGGGNTWTGPVIGASALGDGDLLITEIMVNPNDCADDGAEYVEVINRKVGVGIDPTGLEIRIGSTLGTVTSGVVIPPGRAGALRYSTAGATCHGYPTRGVYGAAAMPNQGTAVEILSSGVRVDRVDATGWAWRVGVSFQLDPLMFNFSTIFNDSSVVWCESKTVIPGGVADLGTPSQLNPACFLDTGGFVPVETFTPGETGVFETGFANFAPDGVSSPPEVAGWWSPWFGWIAGVWGP